MAPVNRSLGDPLFHEFIYRYPAGVNTERSHKGKLNFEDSNIDTE